VTDGSDAGADGVADVAADRPVADAPGDAPTDGDRAGEAGGGDAAADAAGDASPAALHWVWLEAPRGSNVSTLAFDTAGWLYAGFGAELFPSTHTPVSSGVFRSLDHGESWQPASGGLWHFGVNALAGNRGALFAATIALMRSPDMGRTWTEALRPSSVSSFSVVAAGDSGLVLAGEYSAPNGLWVSTDSGVTFQATSPRPGSTATFVSSVAVVESVALVTDSDGLHRSVDGGKSFSDVIDAAGAPFNAQNVMCAPGGFTHICYLTALGSDLSSEISVSLDEGATWTPTGRTDSTALAVTDSDLVYATDDASDNVGGLARSADHGAHWTPLATLPAAAIVMAANAAQVVASTSDGIYNSDDQGATWQLANGSDTIGALTVPAQLLVVDGTASSLGANGDLYLAGGAGLQRSTDDGATWQVVQDGFLPPSCAIAAPAAGGSVIACASGAGVLRSADHGVSFQAVVVAGTVDDPGPGMIQSLSASGATIYAAGADVVDPNPQGLWRSDDAGASFGKVAGAPAAVAVQALRSGHVLAAAADGTYRSIDRGAGWSKLPAAFALPVFEAGSGRLYLAAASGLQISDDEGASWSPAPASPGPAAAERGPIGADSAGQLYVNVFDPGSSSDVPGARVTPASWTLYTAPDATASSWAPAPALPHAIVTGFATDKQGRLFAATNGGVYRLEP
jgi:hypothetical protein